MKLSHNLSLHVTLCVRRVGYSEKEGVGERDSEQVEKMLGVPAYWATN
jgi:hypothetical protein